MAASLLVALAPGVATPLGAAEVLEIQLDTLRLPISLAQLDSWIRRVGPACLPAPAFNAGAGQL